MLESPDREAVWREPIVGRRGQSEYRSSEAGCRRTDLTAGESTALRRDALRDSQSVEGFEAGHRPGRAACLFLFSLHFSAADQPDCLDGDRSVSAGACARGSFRINGAIPAGFLGRAGGESSGASDDRQPGDETLDRHRGDRMVREFRYFGADRCDECAVRSGGEPAVCEAPRDRNFAFGGGRDSVCACRRDHADQRGFSGTDDGGGMGRVPMARGAGARAAGAFGDLSLRAEPETEGLAMDYAGGDGRTVVMAGGVVRVSGVFAVLQYVWGGVRIAGNGDYCDAVVLHFQPGDFAGQRVECGAGERRREERPGRDPAGGPRAEADGGALERLKASTG